MSDLTFVIPGPLDQLTGGYLFARHLVDGLRKAGRRIAVIELPGCFPDADGVARDAAAAALARLENGSRVVIDGLALAGFVDCLARETQRLRILGFVHHPLAEETGLDASQIARFRAIEAHHLPLLRGILCPSPHTAGALAAYGVATNRVAVTPPGTMKPDRQRKRAASSDPLRLLCVATLTPRKGHLLLIDALRRLGTRDWNLLCIGSTERDPTTTAAIRQAIAQYDLGARVTLAGEWPPEHLTAAYEAADLFVLASYHEGYGMAFAEALAHGLPVLGTQAGAIPTTVPAAAGILAPPGDSAALALALAHFCDDRADLARRAEAAALAGSRLPDWPQAVAEWDAAATRLFA